jgi:hypothetical protein
MFDSFQVVEISPKYITIGTHVVRMTIIDGREFQIAIDTLVYVYDVIAYQDPNSSVDYAMTTGVTIVQTRIRA